MNILCKIFGHSLRFYRDSAYCKRWKCDYKEEGTTWDRTVISEVDEVRLELQNNKAILQ